MSSNSLLIMQTVISMGGVIASVTVSAFISGTRWGRVETDMRSLNDRLARIEGMFTLRLRPDETNEHHGHN